MNLDPVNLLNSVVNLITTTCLKGYFDVISMAGDHKRKQLLIAKNIYHDQNPDDFRADNVNGRYDNDVNSLSINRNHHEKQILKHQVLCRL